jgi:hypothetical protein
MYACMYIYMYICICVGSTKGNPEAWSVAVEKRHCEYYKNPSAKLYEVH